MPNTQANTATPLRAAKAPPFMTDKTNPSDLHDLVLAQLDDDQAIEVVSIQLEGKSSDADYMVVASGRSTRQVASMAQKLAEKVKLPTRKPGAANDEAGTPQRRRRAGARRNRS